MYDLQKNIDKILFVTKQRGLSVDQMLKRAELSPSIIANMKRGQKPSVDKIQAISEYLNCSVDYLLGRTDNPNINIFSCYRTYTDNLNKSIVIDKLDIIKLTNFGFVCLNDDNETVAAVDLEVPGSGELIGGSQREDDYDKLINRMKEMNIPLENLDWYTNLRRFGGCYHAGFGLGFERLIMYLTGIENIRDVIPYPRTPNNCDY